ncbi:Protein kinase-like domain and Uncharacterised oxidoreductase Dhs-27 family and CHK kinase-like domain-containing protein [Strongyloides ratti]|uniref:Protein kinase-like domain and Uncharacterized oxidoreductase Dhs-27 family and CHK kinase-like domain-containing protein n=1 Tax=Strongyloides ratti TaxID=34506 RepID=A0A090LQQ8_STRRB|nr:Protein kinase-like domain and Uncharacterised oxidoreductase Dhs-27 family and CHK kinase-like domain-containing protein [Strongyloides ratti]CEF69916.1 Protein kinase-like domain and Uncharacterised oxidoreductase Dhs-27 family and CHK kinase-like domain-containing protein [Strongyloides ratti]
MENYSLFSTQSLEKNYFGNTTITYKWVIDNMETNSKDFRLKRKDSKISKISFNDISGGKGFVSNVYKVTVFFDNNDECCYEFILKIPIFDHNTVLKDLGMEKEKTNDCDFVIKYLIKLHSQECLFYSKIVNEIKDLKVPKCHGCCEVIPLEKSGAIIMDLIDTSEADIISIKYSYNIDQAKSVIDEIFKLQLFSYTDGKNWKSKLQYKTNVNLTTVLKNIVIMHWENCKKIIPKYLLNEIEEDFECLLSNYPEIGIYHIYHLPEAQGDNAVICHGDMWINNIMFSKDSKGRFTNDVKGIIDWQLIYEGAIGVDLARHLAVNCDPDIRHDIENEFLPEYFNKLKNEVIKRNESFDMTYETFRRIYDFCYIDQCVYIIIFIGMCIRQLNLLQEDTNIWEAKKFFFSSKIYFGIRDAVDRVKILKPEWLIKKN